MNKKGVCLESCVIPSGIRFDSNVISRGSQWRDRYLATRTCEAAITTKITRLDHTVSDLRASARDAEGKTAGRLLALAFVLEGCTRA
jgi:hypothetical protein